MNIEIMVQLHKAFSNLNHRSMASMYEILLVHSFFVSQLTYLKLMIAFMTGLKFIFKVIRMECFFNKEISYPTPLDEFYINNCETISQKNYSSSWK